MDGEEESNEFSGRKIMVKPYPQSEGSDFLEASLQSIQQVEGMLSLD